MSALEEYKRRSIQMLEFRRSGNEAMEYKCLDVLDDLWHRKMDDEDRELADDWCKALSEKHLNEDGSVNELPLPSAT